MPQPKGIKKTPGSGRKKGTPNKITQEVIQTLQDNGFDPVLKILYAMLKMEQQCLRQEESGLFPDWDKLSDRYLKLMEFVYPKRKAIELSGDVGVQTSVVAEADAFLERHKENIEKAREWK